MKINLKVKKDEETEESVLYVLELNGSESGSVTYFKSGKSGFFISIYICSDYSGFFINSIDFVDYLKLILKVINKEKLLDVDNCKASYKIDVNYLDEEKTIRKGEIILSKDEFKVTNTFKETLIDNTKK